ncbi:hypothetical protein D3C81_1956250 [compost metagenome]
MAIQGAGGILLAGAATGLGNLVLEVGIEQGQPGVEPLPAIPQQGDFLTDALLRL